MIGTLINKLGKLPLSEENHRAKIEENIYEKLLAMINCTQLPQTNRDCTIIQDGN